MRENWPLVITIYRQEPQKAWLCINATLLPAVHERLSPAAFFFVLT